MGGIFIRMFEKIYVGAKAPLPHPQKNVKYFIKYLCNVPRGTMQPFTTSDSHWTGQCVQHHAPPINKDRRILLYSRHKKAPIKGLLFE